MAKRNGTSDRAMYTRKKRLEQKNTRLQKPVAERDLEIELMKEIAAEK